MKFIFKLITSPNGRWARIGLGAVMILFGVGLEK
ncbi:MAG: hypothetical protein UT08_C0005G0117 [Candidatus Woesebacteria bacterium GW2011_GWB1_38_8]|uniref:Uncharacterized protein n=1 Tax=Candidatus Woesebacteria bacterium GW2011_GWB1_38_8 TaxID=1618570 RepID=A0A0G0P8N7_9BACT|nr:MAG: hypothetical protein UT08_C0005G0117 [Candidatus Woesebacteria bacterium GW2011_GWB1_38_8]